MPNIRSAKKRMRQAARRREQNRQQRRRLRSAVKRVRLASGDAAREAFNDAERLLDRAARKGLISRNAAARSKRRLSKALSASK
ncbi:MAG TPA: 30S ribosomal protein S20 [Gemmatimonadales bacterium]